MVQEPKIVPSPEFRRALFEIRARCIMEGKKPPSIAKMTSIMMKKLKIKELLRNEFIRF